MDQVRCVLVMPIDGMTLLAPLEAGSFGMRTRNASVTNRHHLRPHLARCLTASVRSDVLRQLLRDLH